MRSIKGQLENVKTFFFLQSEALRKLSLVPRQIVSTGGGAVVRPVNWYTGAVDIEFSIFSYYV